MSSFANQKQFGQRLRALTMQAPEREELRFESSGEDEGATPTRLKHSFDYSAVARRSTVTQGRPTIHFTEIFS